MSSIYLSVDARSSGLAPGTPVYMYVVGLVSVAATPTTPAVETFYRLDSTGMPQVMQGSDNTQPAFTFPGSDTLPTSAVDALKGNYPLAWADYSIPISLTEVTKIDLAKINPNNCPGLGTGTAAFSGRIYFSVGIPKLPLSPIGSPATGYTAPVFVNPPGNQTLFDWIEFSFDSNQAFNGNTTQVDQFGFPLTLNGTPGGSLQGMLNKTRAEVTAAFGSGLSGPLGDGVLQVPVNADARAAYPEFVNFLRVISPKTLSAENDYTGTLNSFYDGVINSSYTTWETTPLVTHDQSTGYYTGYVPKSAAGDGGDSDSNSQYAGELIFFQGQFSSVADMKNKTPDFVLGRIDSYEVWQCEGKLAAGDAAQKNVGKMIAAALNRGVIANSLDDATCSGDAASFYPAGGTFNEWSQLFHEFSENGLAYGFPYDDVCDQNPSIGITGTTAIEITIDGFWIRKFEP